MSIIVNSRISFVFALMKCSFAAFGEQNKIDNDSKCQLVYKSPKKVWQWLVRVINLIDDNTDNIARQSMSCRA